jgi:photosystem II stability/assembly factor-like uncharacterized protein
LHKESAFVSPQRGWALTSVQLFDTRDGGAKWNELLTSDGKGFFSALPFSSPDAGRIVGTGLDGEDHAALILHTADGGKSWSEQPLSYGQGSAAARATGLFAVSRCGPAVMWAAGGNAVFRTTDEGGKREVKYVNAGAYLRDVRCLDSERAPAVGFDGLALYTRDGGETWERLETGAAAHLSARL